MPEVGKRQFKYTKKGMARAKAAARRSGKPVVYKKKKK